MHYHRCSNLTASKLDASLEFVLLGDTGSLAVNMTFVGDGLCLH
jgi:hypothetical protein